MKLLTEEYIVSVKLFEKQLRPEIYFSEGIKKTFWRSGRPSGFYKFDIYSHTFLDEGCIKRMNCYIEGRSVYYYPHIEIKTRDGKSHCQFFDTVDEAIRKMEIIKTKIKAIEF